MKKSELKQLIKEIILSENVTIPVNVGDTILRGRFKNIKTKVTDISKDENGQSTINGKKMLTFRMLPKKSKTIKEAIDDDNLGYNEEPNELESPDAVMGYDTAMVIMSHLSDLQEEFPDARKKINAIKAIFLEFKKGKNEMTQQELDNIFNKWTR